MDLQVIQQFIKKVQELNTLFQEMQTLKQQEVGLKLLTSLLKRNETRLGGRFKMKTVIWYSMKDFEKFFDICSDIVFNDEAGDSHIKEEFDKCLYQFSISDYDIVTNMEQIVIKLAHQLDAIEITLDYNEENSVMVSENDSSDYIMGIDMNTDFDETINKHGLDDGNQVNHTALNENLELKQDNNDKDMLHNCPKYFDEVSNKVTYKIENQFTENLQLSGDETNSVEKGAESSSELITIQPFTEALNDTSERADTHKEIESFTTDIKCYPTEHVEPKIEKIECEIIDDDSIENYSVANLKDQDCMPNRETKYDESCTDIGKQQNPLKKHDYFTRLKQKNRKHEIELPETDQFNFLKTIRACKSKLNAPNESVAKDVCDNKVIGKNSSVPMRNITTTSKSMSRNTKASSIIKLAGSKSRKRSRSYRCDKCDKSFCRETLLNQHYRAHVGDEFCCSVCGSYLESLTHLIGHMATHQEDSNLVCQICDKVFTETHQYRHHLASHSPNLCTLCNKTFPTQRSLGRHNKLVHGITDKSDGVVVESRFRCDVCGSRFTKEVNYMRHRAKHTGENPYKCEMCYMSFKTRQMFTKHIQTIKHNIKMGNVDVDRQYLCQQCGKAYLRKDALRRHEKHHTGEKRHMCQFCGFKCQESDNLKRHIALHFESHRNFICEICGSAFHTKKTLEVHHQFKHSDERNHSCSNCDMSFKAKSSLIRHMKVHSQEKKHLCWCGTAYKSLYNLRRHLNKMHGGDSVLPPVKHVQTLDCPVKNAMSKTDFHSKYEDQSMLLRGDDFDQPDIGNEENQCEASHNIRFEVQNDNVQMHNTASVSAIPTIDTFRHTDSLPQESFSLDNIQQYSHCDGKEANVHESVNVNITDQLRDESTDTCVYGHDSKNLLSNQSTEDVKTNLPQFSLYGYPPPYHNGLPQFMYMPPLYEPTIHTPASFPSYEQLIKFGSIFPTPNLQQAAGMNTNVPVARLIEPDGYGAAAAPSLSQDQLRVLHHEIYSRLSQEEISQRLNSDAYRLSLSQIENVQQKADNVQATIEFDYTQKRDCSYDQTTVDKLTTGGDDEKETGEASHEDVYESSIDADYSQSRREMAAESLALMSALTPEPVYNGQDLNNQML